MMSYIKRNYTKQLNFPILIKDGNNLKTNTQFFKIT